MGVAESLNKLEKNVLPALLRHSAVQDIMKETGLAEVEVMRVLFWLESKGLAKTTEQIEEIVKLGSNGVEYAKSTLPEIRFLEALTAPKRLDQIKKDAGLSDNEASASIGTLMREKAIEGKGGVFQITETGKKIAKEKKTQKFLGKTFPARLKELTEEEKEILAELRKRKDVVAVEAWKKRSAILTKTGEEIARSAHLQEESAEKLTPEMLASGQWKNVKFRSYDVNAPVPRMQYGKLQPYREFLEEVRIKFTGLGFQEMTGPIIESEFWNMDALFMPQFHSARDIHDAYYIKEPKNTKDLPAELLKKVKAAHENGEGTGGLGWRYKFSEEKTKRLIMRSQTTACSARKLAEGIKMPAKYFAIGRCFRADVIDAKHLADFNQVEGIVAEEGINLTHLIGLLKLFAKEFCGTDQAKVVPSYFPFTEPSASLYAKHPVLGWMELGGAGIFRPEMVLPLTGKNMPVIAWGIGIDRIAMFKLGISDIRELFSHNLALLRSAKVV